MDTQGWLLLNRNGGQISLTIEIAREVQLVFDFVDGAALAVNL